MKSTASTISTTSSVAGANSLGHQIARTSKARKETPRKQEAHPFIPEEASYDQLSGQIDMIEARLGTDGEQPNDRTRLEELYHKLKRQQAFDKLPDNMKD